jgi:hypothetical protein
MKRLGEDGKEGEGRADDLAAALVVARRTSDGNSGDGEGRVRRRRVAEAGDRGRGAARVAQQDDASYHLSNNSTTSLMSDKNVDGKFAIRQFNCIACLYSY